MTVAATSESQPPSATLEMVSSATADRQAGTASIGESFQRLQNDIDRLAAENKARRDLASVAEQEPSNQLSRSWSRLEKLKTHHEKATAAKEGKETDDDKERVQATKAERRTADVEIVIKGASLKATGDVVDGGAGH